MQIDKKATEYLSKTITVNGVEYEEEQLSDVQKVLISHVADLDHKVASARFNLDQLQVSRDAFMQMLLKDLDSANAAN